MKTTTKEIIDMKVGELNLSVPYTTEGMKVVRAMVTFLEVDLGGEEKKKHEPDLSPFSHITPLPNQRMSFKEWEPLVKTKAGTLYKEVASRVLEMYKDGVEPPSKEVSLVIREMYGDRIKETSVAAYTSRYKRYIRENKLAETPSETHSNIGYKKSLTLRKIPMEQVCKIWNLLSDEFSFKQAKALITTDITQSGARIDACNFTIKEFKENPAFGCLETSPGIFLKITKEKGEED